MKHLKFFGDSVNDRYIDEAVRILRDGGVIIYPTDTVYALGCDALNNSAIERLCKIKNVDPRKQTLSVVCDGISMASEYARIDNEAYRILRRNLPGPFTFILPAATTLPKVFKGRKEVGIHVPDNNITKTLVERLGNPLLSASLPQDDSDLEPAAIALDFENVAEMLIDGGTCDGQLSTVVDITDSRSPEIVREGKGSLQ